MSILVKVQRKGVINIPAEIRTAAGISKGDMIEASFQKGKVILIPKTIMNRTSTATKRRVSKEKRSAR